MGLQDVGTKLRDILCVANLAGFYEHYLVRYSRPFGLNIFYFNSEIGLGKAKMLFKAFCVCMSFVMVFSNSNRIIIIIIIMMIMIIIIKIINPIAKDQIKLLLLCNCRNMNLCPVWFSDMQTFTMKQCLARIKFHSHLTKHTAISILNLLSSLDMF